MERRFNLIKSDGLEEQRRIFPRFPFCYMTFKTDTGTHVFEVRDISFSGMQLKCQTEAQKYDESEMMKGVVHWLGDEMPVEARVKWKTKSRLGVEFIKRQNLATDIKKFLSIKHLASRLKPLHDIDFGVDLPSKLKYWLRSDGPVEIFVWQHADGEFSEFQVLLLENFIEWKDGMGIKTGRILSKRNVDSPLITEDEMLFNLDAESNDEKLAMARDLIALIPEEAWSLEAREFLLRKLK